MISVNAPYVIFSTRARKIESFKELNDSTDIFLSTEDGVLLSLNEVLTDNDYRITIDLFDPNGIFISRIMQSRQKAMKNFLSMIKTEEVETETSFPSSKAIDIFEDPVKLETLQAGDEFSVSQIGLDQEGGIAYAFQNSPRIFLLYGASDLDNSTGWRSLTIENVFLSQDTQEPYRVRIEGVLGSEFLKVTDDGDEFFSSDDEGTPSRFPFGEALERRSYDYLTVDRVYTPNGSGEYSFSNEVVDNKNKIKDIVHMIEMLLQDYLCVPGQSAGSDDTSPLPIIFLSQKLQDKILEGYKDPTSSEIEDNVGISSKWLTSNLVHRLEKCGIGTLISNEYNVVKYLNSSNTPMRSKYSMRLEIDDSKSKLENVLEVIRRLYGEFGILDTRIEAVAIDNPSHAEIFIKKFFVKEGNQYINYYDFGVTSDSIVKVNDSVFEDGFIKNIVLIGESNFITSVIFPNPLSDSNEDLLDYDKFVKEAWPPSTSTNQSNMDKFIAGIGQAPAPYKDYIKSVYNSYSREYVDGEGAVPDEFSVNQPTYAKQSWLKNYTFLNCNDKNTNVLSLRLKDIKAHWSQVSLTKFPIFEEKGAKETLAILSSSNRTGLEEGDKLTDEKIDKILFLLTSNSLKDISSRINLQSILGRSVSNDELVSDYKEQLKDLLSEIQKTSAAKNKVFDDYTLMSYVLFMKKLKSTSTEVTVKLLPDYRLTGSYFKGKPVWLNHKNPKAIGVENSFSQMSFITGQYKVIGYKQVLSAEEAYTEVNLIRSDLNIADTAGKVMSEMESKI